MFLLSTVTTHTQPTQTRTPHKHQHIDCDHAPHAPDSSTISSRSCLVGIPPATERRTFNHLQTVLQTVLRTVLQTVLYEHQPPTTNPQAPHADAIKHKKQSTFNHEIYFRPETKQQRPECLKNHQPPTTNLIGPYMGRISTPQPPTTASREPQTQT